ncbi:hypothetical protein HBA_0126 [Sodalis endosymbiont of Henestaris halophilus]|nr:hypothetical protein HBA_0126 [Sodalis endosymbiont of Henestaris halophilus]
MVQQLREFYSLRSFIKLFMVTSTNDAILNAVKIVNTANGNSVNTTIYLSCIAYSL